MWENTFEESTRRHYGSEGHQCSVFFPVPLFEARGNFEKSAREIQKIARGKSQVKFATGKNGHKILPPKKINNGKFW